MLKITKNVLMQFVRDDICEIPILYNCCNIAFSVAEEFRNKVCVPCWYDCREIFHADYPKPNHIFINHKKYKFQKLKVFIQSLESKLFIKRKSKIYKTAKKTAMLVVLSPYWRDKCLFGLFTLLVRAAAYNSLDTFDITIINKCKYLHDTRNALRLIIAGRNKYVGKHDGWYKQFKGLTIEECKKLLKP
jgi:hypothetical protein